MKLICEVNEDIETLVEKTGEGTSKDYFIKGVFLQAEQKNRNGRVYPLETMQKEAKVTNIKGDGMFNDLY